MKDNQKTLNILARGAIITFAGLFGSKALAYLYRVYIGRSLGPEAYGILSIGIAVTGIATSISTLSQGSGLQRFLPKAESQKKEEDFIKSSLSLTLPVSFVLTAGMFLLSPQIASIFGNQNAVSVIRVLALVPIFDTLMDISVNVAKAHKKQEYHIITSRIFQNVVQLTVTVLLIHLNYGVVGAAWGWVAGVVLSAFLGWYLLKTRIIENFSLSLSFESQRKKMLRYSLPLLMSGLVGSLLGWTDTLFIGYLLQESQVGIYNAALPTAAMLGIPLSAVGSLMLPAMSEIIEDVEKARETIKTTSYWSLLLSTPIFTILFLFSSQVLRIMFSKEFLGGAMALSILSIGYLFNAATGNITELVKASDKTDLIFKNTLGQVALNIPLNIVLIPRWGAGLGIAGAAVATASSMILVNTLLVIESKYLLNISPFSKKMIKPFLASLIPAIGIYYLTNSIFKIVPLWALILSTGIYGLLYLSSLILLKSFREEEIEIFIAVGRKIGKENLTRKLLKLLRMDTQNQNQ
ncbi:MAG: oligosaccharide flippase family protein [Candidatus Nanohaloarchaea archaeon]